MHVWCRGKWVVLRLVILVWFAYIWVQMIRDPSYYVIFDSINLGIHELGHYIWMPFGRFVMFLGGSMTQCLAPLASVPVFYRQRDYFAMAFCFGWLSTCFYSVATYIGDARAQILPLVTPGGGEPQHDWHYLLNTLGLLEQDPLLATMTRGLGAISMLIFLIAGAYQVWLMFSLPKNTSDTSSELEFENDNARKIDE
jgi:hypothetical protein